MVAQTIVWIWTFFSLSKCSSVEFQFLYSVAPFGEQNEQNFYYGCRVCSGSLQWFLDGSSIGGFVPHNEVGDFKFRADSNLQDIAYLSILLESTNENNEICLTSMLLAHQLEQPIVECRANSDSQTVNDYYTSLVFDNDSNGSVSMEYVFSKYIVPSNMSNYTYVLLCKVQNRADFSIEVDNVLVQRFTTQSNVGIAQLHDSDIFIETALLSKHPLPMNSLTAILVVSVVNSSEGFNATCRTDVEEVTFDLPVQSSISDVSNDSSTTDSSTTESISAESSDFKDSTSPNPIDPTNSNDFSAPIIAGTSVLVTIIILVMITTAIFIPYCIIKRRKQRNQDRKTAERYCCRNGIQEEDRDDVELDGPVSGRTSTGLVNDSVAELREISGLKKRK